MSLFTKLFEAVHSWRRRRVGIKPPRKRNGPGMEQLDHRQLLAVNFTGVAANDFPVTNNPGVQVITNPPPPEGTNTFPGIPPGFADLISVSGYQINQLRVSYTAADDTLNVGVEGPNNGRDANQVIAGDADNNGNSGTVNPEVVARDPQFQDPADMGGTETYGISLSLDGDATPEVLAGFPIGSQTDLSAKPFQVARALAPDSNSSNPLIPQFDQAQTFPQFTGNYYLANDPGRPNFELQIPRFSQLYQQITGQAFTSTSPLAIGAFAASDQSGGISEEVFPALPVSIPQITVPPPTPPPPVVCPPMSPTVYVNYHQGNHVNTAHNGPIRVNVLGSSGFDPTTIIPSSVRFGDPATIATNGATPVLNFERNVNNDGFPDETFVFNGLDVQLPAGVTTAQIVGTTTSGQTFSSSVRVFNRDATYYSPAAINAQQARWAAYDDANGVDTSNGIVAPPVRVPTQAQVRATSAAIDDLYNPFAGKTAPAVINPGAINGQAGTGVVSAGIKGKAAKAHVAAQTVSIPKKNGTPVKAAKAATPQGVKVQSQAKAQPKVQVRAAAQAKPKARVVAAAVGNAPMTMTMGGGA